jgi:hypothetical protein
LLDIDELTFTGTGAITSTTTGLTLDSGSGTVSIAAGDTLGNGTWSIDSSGVGISLTATDLSCTDCIGATEVDESTISSTGLSDTANIGYLNQAETVSSGWEFSSAIAANGGITFDNATDTLGAFTAAGNIDLNTSYVLVNIGAGGTDFSGTGGLTLADTLSVTAGGASIADGALAVNSDSITSDGALVINATSTVKLGDGTTNYFDFSETSGPTYYGTARPTRQVTLSPEYSGALLTGDGGSNTGTMTSDFCEQGASADIPDTNTAVCNTSGDIHNYYNWTTGEASVQDYDIWIRWRVPDNFPTDGFSAVTDPIKVYGKRTDVTNNAVTVYVYDTGGTLENTSGTQVAGTTWTETSVEATFAGTYTAGQYMTIRIVMAADTGGDLVQAGEISINYKSNN